MTKIRNIYFFSVGRSDFYILKNLLDNIAVKSKININIVLTGMHFAKVFGSTNKDIKKNKKINYHYLPINYNKNKFNSIDVLKISSDIILQFLKFVKKNKPEVIILLGDRYETLLIAYCATIQKIPIMHFHGGELSFGSYDEQFRHSISKMSYWHFVATKKSQNRVYQLGENKKRIFHIGSLVNDNLKLSKKISKKKLVETINFEFKNKLAIFTYHPTTLKNNEDKKIIKNIIKFLVKKKYYTIISSPNADTNGLEIKKYLLKFISKNKKFCFINNLGSEKYYSLISYADFIIGNSSSGILEAPLIGTPTINVGSRQMGRERSPSVFECKGSIDSLEKCYSKIINFNKKKINLKASPYYKKNPIDIAT